MAESMVTQGALQAIFTNPNLADAQFPVPVLQCLQVKPLAKDSTQAERYRIVLSDMVNYVQCVLGAQANHLIHAGQLVPFCLVRLKAYNPSGFNNKRILIIVDLEVVENVSFTERLGRPVVLDGVGDQAAAGQPAPQEAQQPAQPAPISGTSFYGNKSDTAKPKPAQQQQQQQQQHPSARGTVGRSAGGVNIYPIESLSPYAHKWTIRARVTSKSDIRRWQKKPNGDGKLFSVNLLDETGEIKATAFNEQVDQYYDLFQEGSVYYISNPCRVTMAKKQFSNLPNDYELVFERDTVVEKAEDQGSVPQIRFNFCSIQDLANVEKDATVDVIGVLKDVDDAVEMTSRTTGRPFEKRDITIVDDTKYSVRVTLWGKTATGFEARPEQVLAFKGLKVSDFNGKSLSLLSSGTMNIDPDNEHAHRLKGWYDSQGRMDDFHTHTNNMSSLSNATGGRSSEIKLIAQAKEEGLGMENQDIFSIKATIVYIRHENVAYPSCPKCNKKVNDEGDGWRCEKCNVSHPKPLYRYILNVHVADHTGDFWLSCFDEVGRSVMGISADELMELREQGDEVSTGALFEAASCKEYVFRVRARMDTYQDQQRIRYQVLGASAVDYRSEGLKLAALIQKYSLQ